MITPNKSLANGRNALHSTGPKSAKGRAVRPETRLHTGYTPRPWFRPPASQPKRSPNCAAAVRRELRPRGVIAERLADRIGLTLLRLDRVTKYEAAVASAGTANLPPDPDAITGAGVDLSLPAPGPDAPPAARLARARLEGWVPAREACRTAVAALNGRNGVDPLALPGAHPVRREIEDALGWTWEQSLRKWNAATQDGPPTAAEFRRLVARLARDAGTPTRSLTRLLRERLAARAEEYDQPIAEMTAETERVAAGMRTARERAAATAVYADGEAVDRVMRMEGHLTRQLRLTLDELDRLRGEVADGADGGFGVLVREVLAGAPRTLPLPAAVGSFRGGEGGPVLPVVDRQD